ncbi:MAG: SDR family oxidoreductase [Myxococcota bacterium]
MRVLIAGCGYVGTALGEELAGAGHVVWGLRRDPTGLPAPLHPIAADLTDPSTLDALPGEVDRVVYAASPAEASDRGYADAYVRGLENLLRSLERRGARIGRALLTTSTAVYAQSDGAWVDEASPTEPTHFSGKRLLEGEQVLASSPHPTVAVRLAGIYGPGRTGMLRRVRDGEARCPALPRYSNRIHRTDCAGFLAHLLLHPDPASVYIGADDAPVELCEAYGWIADRLGVPRPERESPNQSAGDGRRGRSNKRCRNDRLHASGYALRVPTYREGYAPLIDALTDHHAKP